MDRASDDPKPELIQSHWGQMKPRLDQGRVLIETEKKQEDGLQAPTEVNGSGKTLCRITELNARIVWLKMGFQRQSTHGPRVRIEAETSVEAGRRAEARGRRSPEQKPWASKARPAPRLLTSPRPDRHRDSQRVQDETVLTYQKTNLHPSQSGVLGLLDNLGTSWNS